LRQVSYTCARDTVGFIARWCKGCWVIVIFGEAVILKR